MLVEQEGVIKFQLIFDKHDICIDEISLDTLNQYRREMIDLGLIGQDVSRYEGYGFGNISQRVANYAMVDDVDKDAFWISGTQTGHLSNLSSKDVSLVAKTFPSENKLIARGHTQPSSESMSHGVLFQLSPRFNAVIHVHSPDIWSKRKQLGLASTPDNVAYGSPEMARSVSALAKKLMELEWPIIFCMDGHEDGVIVAGEDLAQCSKALTKLLEYSRSLTKANLD